MSLGPAQGATQRPIIWKNKQFALSVNMAAVEYQLTRFSRRRLTAPGTPAASALVVSQAEAKYRARRYRRWMRERRIAA